MVCIGESRQLQFNWGHAANFGGSLSVFGTFLIGGGNTYYWLKMSGFKSGVLPCIIIYVGGWWRPCHQCKKVNTQQIWATQQNAAKHNKFTWMVVGNHPSAQKGHHTANLTMQRIYINGGWEPPISAKTSLFQQIFTKHDILPSQAP